MTNSKELQRRILEDETPDKENEEEDQSYAKASLGVKSDEEPGVTKVLGVQWQVAQDKLQFDLGDVAETMENFEPTKRNLVSITAKFFDPLGVVSPVTILFKMFCQQICEAKLGWDDPLSNPYQEKWTQLLSMLKGARTITIPRCVNLIACPKTARLMGFCDASAKVYAAIVYLRVEDENHVDVKFLAAKTRVTPVLGVTIPRLELLSALLLAKLLTSIRDAMRSELSLNSPVCYTDSKAALWWIRGIRHEWKQFVENRVNAIRSLVPPECWEHCPGAENPADIPSRGMSAAALSESSIRLNGPDWLWNKTIEENVNEEDVSEPEDCKVEMKSKDSTHSLVAIGTGAHSEMNLDKIICITRHSSAYRLFRVTALVLRFIALMFRLVNRHTKSMPSSEAQISTEEIERAKLLWIIDMQSQLTVRKQFPVWKEQFGLILDEKGVWRCGGRMAKSTLPLTAKNPILLDKEHHLTTLLIIEAHKRVLHNGVRETLADPCIGGDRL